MKKRIFPGIIALMIGFFGADLSAEAVLYRDGAACAAIVLPRKPNNVEQLSAQELGDHLRLATGSGFPVVREDKYDATAFPYAVYIGNCEAARQAGVNTDALDRFQGIIRVAGNNLYLAGKDDPGDLLRSVGDFSGRSNKMMVSAGTLFAVYDFLDRELGVIHLWPGKSGLFVPKKSELKFAAFERIYKPWSRASCFWLNRYISEKHWEKAETLRTLEREQRFWLLRHRFCNVEKNVNCEHEFRDYWRRFGQTHPEYFNRLPNGERRPLAGDIATKAVTMCVSNPGLHRQIAEDYKARYNPELRPWVRNRLSVGENDTPGLCTCETCRSWDDPNDKRFAAHPYWSGKVIPVMGNRFTLLRATDGAGSAAGAPSLSDRYSRFYLAVQTEARKVNPEVNVIGFAYTNYADPPKLTKLNENVIISFVGWPFFPFTSERMAQAREHWDGWRATGAGMLLRPNATHSGHNMPVFYGRKLGNEFLHAQKNGAVAVDYDSLTGQWGAQSASLYILCRLQARPDLTVDAVLAEYYSAFGPAADTIRAYTEYLEQVSDAVTMEQVYAHTKKLKLSTPPGFKNWLQLADLVFSPEFFVEAGKILEKAALEAKGDPAAAEKVEFLQVGLEHAGKTLQVLLKQREYRANPTEANKLVFQEAFKELWQYRHSIEGYLGTSLDYLVLREAASGWEYQPEP